MTLRKGKLIRCRSGVDSSLCEERSKFPKGLGCQLPDRQPLPRHAQHDPWAPVLALLFSNAQLKCLT